MFADTSRGIIKNRYLRTLHKVRRVKVVQHQNLFKLCKLQTLKREHHLKTPREFLKMSLFFSNDDGLHIERINAEEMRKRGYFINVHPNVAPMVRDDYGRTQSEHQAPSTLARLRNNLKISPDEHGREAFAQTSSREVSKRREKLCHYIQIMQITNNILTAYNF